MFRSYRKSGSANPFPVTNLRPEIELMHLLYTHRHYTCSHKSCRKQSRTPEVTASLKENTYAEFIYDVRIYTRSRHGDCACPVKISQTKSCIGRLKLSQHTGNLCRWVHFRWQILTRYGINALTAHAQTLLSCLKHTALDRLRVSSLERYLVLELRIQKLNSRKIYTVHELQQRIIYEWKRLDQRVIDNAVKQWRRHLRFFVAAKGGYFEQSL